MSSKVGIEEKNDLIVDSFWLRSHSSKHVLLNERVMRIADYFSLRRKKLYPKIREAKSMCVNQHIWNQFVDGFISKDQMSNSLPKESEMRPCFLFNHVSMSKMNKLNFDLQTYAESIFCSS